MHRSLIDCQANASESGLQVQAGLVELEMIVRSCCMYVDSKIGNLVACLCAYGGLIESGQDGVINGGSGGWAE